MALQWADLTWLAICYLLFTPIGIYFSIKFYEKYRKGDPLIVQRQPKLVLYILTASIYYICFHQPLYIFFVAFIHTSPSDHLWEFIFDNIGYQIVFMLYFLRLWHIYYDFKHNEIKADRIWKLILNNEAYRCDTYNFFINNRNKYGNIIYTRFVVLMYILLYGAILVIIIYFTETLYYIHYISVIITIIFLIPFIYIFYNHITESYDTIYIRNEILIQSFIIIIFSIFEVFNILIISLFINSSNNNFEHIELLIESIIPSIIFFINILVSTYYIFYREKKEKLFIRLHSFNFNHSIDDIGEHNHVDLMELLQTKDGFHLFMRHTVQEYALSNLLFVIEITQYKQYCINQITNTPEGLENKKTFTNDLISLYPSMILSEIVSSTSTNIRDKYVNLHLKFISVENASFPVNISSNSKKSILRRYVRFNSQRLRKIEEEENDKSDIHRNKYNNITNREIYDILNSFNSSLRDVIKCLKDSYSRFYITKEYQSWHKKHIISKYKKHKNSKDNTIHEEQKEECKEEEKEEYVIMYSK